LVGLGLALGVLDIDARVAGPGRLEDGMTAAVLPGLAKVGLAHFLQIVETHIGGLTAHLFQKFSMLVIQAKWCH